MNRKGKELDIGEIIGLAVLALFVIPLIGVIISMITGLNCPKCETCDYSPYQNTISNYSSVVSNLTKQLNEIPIRYIQNVTYQNVTEVVQEVVYRDTPVSITIIAISFVLSLAVTITLFKVEIKLPKEIEEKIKKIEKVILAIKISSVVVSLLTFIKLIMIFASLF